MHDLRSRISALAAAALAAAALLLAACGDDGAAAPADGGGDAGPADTTGGDTTARDTAAGDAAGGDAAGGADAADGPVQRFRFGTAPDQPISAAPFPNDLYRGADGRVTIAPLEDDPRLGGLAKAALLAAWTDYANERTGFGAVSPVWFFTDGPIDEGSLAGRVRIVGLAGTDAGRVVAANPFWSEPAGGVGVHHAWGDYLVAETTYAVVVTSGVTAGGQPVAPPPAVATLLADARPEGALGALWDTWQPLREWLATAGIAPADVAVATVFTTEPVLPLGAALFDAVAAFPLVPPTRRVRYAPDAGTWEEADPVEGATLEDYFGVPMEPFPYNPGLWLGSRENAARLPDVDAPYEGGTAHFGIGRVLNGSLEVPSFNVFAVDGALANERLRLEDGVPQSELNAVVPFTLYLCDDHLADPSDLPVAVFSHGGGAIRADAAPYAVANCQLGLATIAIDMVFHGGRLATRLLAGEGLIAPTAEDRENAFTGLAEGDDGYVTDRIGDDAAAVAAVAPLYAVGVDADPLVIEANLLTIAADTATLLRYLREGDWSQVQAGLSFDPDRIVHESISFGTSFHTPLLALDDGLAALVGSVASGEMLTVNLLMAPVNAAQAAAVLSSVLGLKTPLAQFQTWSLVDPVLSVHLWLHGRGDPMAWAPYLLRHRPTDALPPVLHNGDSWDETLYGPAQVSYVNALGLPTYTEGAAWTIDPAIPGADTLSLTPAPGAPIRDNVTYGGATTTAAIFWSRQSCHGQQHAAICGSSFEHPYPPIRLRDERLVEPSPVCALQTQIIAFLRAVLEDGAPAIVPPGGTCEALYGP